MKGSDVLMAGLAAASAAIIAEAVLRRRDLSASKARFLRERRTIERSWERFDLRSGWELVPGFESGGVRVNRHGFRGPELGDGTLGRIVCLGGTNTFGPPCGENTYPRALSTALAEAAPERPFEVVNAGVTGHSTVNMLFRTDRIRRLRPDIVVIYAGPEDVFLDDITRYPDNRRPFSSYWHAGDRRNVRFHLLSLLLDAAGSGRNKPFPLSFEPEEFVPFNFAYNLSRIAGAFRDESAVALLTIPSLVPKDLKSLIPNEIRAISLPDFLEADLDAFAAVLGTYNESIQAVAEETGASLIDAAAAFERAEIPRGRLFTGTFDLSEEGCNLLGGIVARELAARGFVS